MSDAEACRECGRSDGTHWPNYPCDISESIEQMMDTLERIAGLDCVEWCLHRYGSEHDPECHVGIAKAELARQRRERS